jgi:hypothetical protein
VERTAGPGEAVVVPPGTPHLAWNPTRESVELRITMAPALRWAELVERLFAGEPASVLLAEFAREIRVVRRVAASTLPGLGFDRGGRAVEA